MLKILAALFVSLSGWLATMGAWKDGLAPLAVAGLLGILGSQISGIILIVPPSVKQREDIALLSGVHTPEQVTVLQKITVPGTIPTPEVIKAVQAIAPDPPAAGPSPEVMAKIAADIKAGSLAPPTITTASADGSYKTEPNPKAP